MLGYVFASMRTACLQVRNKNSLDVVFITLKKKIYVLSLQKPIKEIHKIAHDLNDNSHGSATRFMVSSTLEAICFIVPDTFFCPAPTKP